MQPNGNFPTRRPNLPNPNPNYMFMVNPAMFTPVFMNTGFLNNAFAYNMAYPMVAPPAVQQANMDALNAAIGRSAALTLRATLEDPPTNRKNVIIRGPNDGTPLGSNPTRKKRAPFLRNSKNPTVTNMDNFTEKENAQPPTTLASLLGQIAAQGTPTRPDFKPNVGGPPMKLNTSTAKEAAIKQQSKAKLTEKLRLIQEKVDTLNAQSIAKQQESPVSLDALKQRIQRMNADPKTFIEEDATLQKIALAYRKRQEKNPGSERKFLASVCSRMRRLKKKMDETDMPLVIAPKTPEKPDRKEPKGEKFLKEAEKLLADPSGSEQNEYRVKLKETVQKLKLSGLPVSIPKERKDKMDTTKEKLDDLALRLQCCYQIEQEEEKNKNGEVFCTVLGRLPSDEGSRNFTVTVEEMHRRCQGPERLNSSSLALNLRRAKVKNCGEFMRNQLLEKGVEVSKKRMAVYPRKIIPLTELETHYLVKTIGYIHRQVPIENALAEDMVDDWIDDSTPQEFKLLPQKVFFFRRALGLFEDQFNTVMPPLNPFEMVYSRDAELNKQMDVFSAVTHGFGICSQKLYIKQLYDIANELCHHPRLFHSDLTRRTMVSSQETWMKGIQDKDWPVQMLLRAFVDKKIFQNANNMKHFLIMFAPGSKHLPKELSMVPLPPPFRPIELEQNSKRRKQSKPAKVAQAPDLVPTPPPRQFHLIAAPQSVPPPTSIPQEEKPKCINPS